MDPRDKLPRLRASLHPVQNYPPQSDPKIDDEEDEDAGDDPQDVGWTVKGPMAEEWERMKNVGPFSPAE